MNDNIERLNVKEQEMFVFEVQKEINSISGSLFQMWS